MTDEDSDFLARALANETKRAESAEAELVVLREQLASSESQREETVNGNVIYERTIIRLHEELATAVEHLDEALNHPIMFEVKKPAARAFLADYQEKK